MDYATLKNETAEALYRRATDLAERFCAAKGYNSAVVSSVLIDRARITFSFALEDNFQTKLDYSERYKHGLVSLHVYEDDETLDALFAAWPSREARELNILMTRLSGVVEMKDHLVALAGQKFVAEVIRARDEFLALPKPEGAA